MSQIESLTESHRVKAAEVADRAAETVDQISPNFQILIQFGDMANGVALFQVRTLNNSNYDNWNIRMKALLGAHDVWDLVENSYNEP